MTVIFLKTHVDAYTKKDGTFVAAHEDKRQKHSPEQIAKWAAEKQARERAQADQREKDRQSEKNIYQKYADGVASTASGKDFTPDEIDDIRGYYMSGDKHGALAEGRNAAVSAIERNLRAAGVEIEHVSESQGGKSKSLYVKVNGEIVRVSDHELPETPERQANREAGRTGRWSREVIVSDWQGTSIDDYLNEIKGGEVTSNKPSMIKSILFFKGFIGPYLRGGKMVNLKGYHSKKTKKVTAVDGQSSLFADLAPPPEVKQTAKVARALTTWMDRHGGPAGMARLLADMSPEHQGKLVDAMAKIGKTDVATVRGMLQAEPAPAAPSEPNLFSEPKHTEPTRELIAEHERLVDVLNSPSHEDDKAEAKKQAAELEEMKQEVAKQPTKAQQTRARRQAVLDVLGEGWKGQAGVDGAKDRYTKVFPKADGGKLEVTIMPEKTVEGNFYVGSYHRGGKRTGSGSNDSSAKTIEEAKAIAERFAGVGAAVESPSKPAQQDLVDHIKYLGGERKKDLLELAAHIDDFGYSNSVPDSIHIPVKNAAAAINHITKTSRISTEHGLAARKLTGAKARKVLAEVAAAGGLGSIQDHIDAFHRVMGGQTMTKSILLLRRAS